MKPEISIIIPALNEAESIRETLDSVKAFENAEIILADGGSTDETILIAENHGGVKILHAPRGRGIQLRCGADAAGGEILWFLHADTRLPDNAVRIVREGLATSGRVWGRFDVRFGEGPLLGLIAFFMNLRSRITGIATGDQAIFVSRTAFLVSGGFPAIALMEDVALSTRLKRQGRPLCLRARVTTSPRRWKENGTLRTVFLMWRLRLAYFLGADPRRLAQRYGYSPAE